MGNRRAERLRELFGEDIASLQTERRNFAFRHPSAEYYAGFMCSYYVPLYKTFEALDEEN